MSNSCIDPSPNVWECIIEASKRAPAPTVAALVGACKRVMESLNFSKPMDPTSEKIAPIISQKAMATVAMISKVIR